MGAFMDANLDANMDCEILLEILAAESERELQHEIATVQMDLQKGITDITNEDCDADLIEALRASAQTFEEERRLYHNVELTQRALFALESSASFPIEPA